MVLYVFRSRFTGEISLQQERHVEESRWDPSEMTHLNGGILTKIARAILGKIPVFKFVNLLEPSDSL